MKILVVLFLFISSSSAIAQLDNGLYTCSTKGYNGESEVVLDLKNSTVSVTLSPLGTIEYALENRWIDVKDSKVDLSYKAARNSHVLSVQYEVKNLPDLHLASILMNESDNGFTLEWNIKLVSKDATSEIQTFRNFGFCKLN